MTSDERREVADSLRARAVGVGFAYRDVYALNDGWVYRTLREIVEAIGCAGNPHPAEWMARLADLIDPTCHAIEKGHPDEHHVCYGCNVCSFGWYESVNDEPYRYCPHCGARVVDDE